MIITNDLPVLNKTLTKITGSAGDNELIFECSDNTKYKMAHYQDCCESVYIQDIDADLKLLIGNPLIQAEEVSCHDRTEALAQVDPVAAVKYELKRTNSFPEYQEESETWTFYKFSTIKGTVVIRWHGSSNGYYSENVDFSELMI